MITKPDLIIMGQYLLGGGTSFNKNMLSCFPTDFFNIKSIYINPINANGAKALDIEVNTGDVIFPQGDDTTKAGAKKLSEHLPNTEGCIVASLESELVSLDLYRKPNKTVFFICHDDGFINLAVKYQSIIDVFIAHNIAVYDELKVLLKSRNRDVYFIQHGVSIPEFEKVYIKDQKLKIVFLARHYKFKGIYDLPIINDLLIENGVEVEWLILGDGPERGNLIKKVEKALNFHFYIPKTSSEVIEILKTQDVFILPSRADGLPVALLESMSVGCVPVIANFSDGIKKVVTEEIGYVLPVGNNQLFAEKLILLSNDRSLLQKLSTSCIEKVKNEFDIKKQALEYYGLYKQYKKFRRKHRIGLKDLLRLMTYNENYNKIIHKISIFKGRLGLRRTAN